MTRRVLIIEDNADIARLVQLHLRDIHCKAEIASDGRIGLEQFKKHPYDLVVLDLMLPGLDGLEVCKALRAEPGYVPILMLTAKTTELDRVLGLEVGADDYLTKPFSIPELMARIKALLRRVDALRTTTINTDETLKFKGLTIDNGKRQVFVGPREVSLTAKEFELLLHFASHPGRVYTRTQLLDQVWGYSHDGYEHTVNSHINRLRAKIEIDPAQPLHILTVWGVGYKFNDTEISAA
ncbi:MAG: response regulator transcription factor [Pseudomonadota bacterium]|nr:response regulator transcription factor [Pseudomonadota bacterium]